MTVNNTVMVPEYHGDCFMARESAIAAIPEKEKLKSNIKIIFKIRWPKIKEVSKKIKASMEKS
jgi:hypothetical protein